MQEQMQHSINMNMNMNMMSAATSNYYSNNNLTTHHIQQYLDENKSLILKIVESQNSGKLSECAENQARLQRNLMYLAAIADSQPQPTMHSQYGQSGMMQPGAQYLQAQQTQQQAARSSIFYTQQQYSALQQQQALHSHLGMGLSGTHMMHSEANTSGSEFLDLRGMTGGGGSKQDREGRSSGDGDDNN